MIAESAITSPMHNINSSACSKLKRRGARRVRVGRLLLRSSGEFVVPCFSLSLFPFHSSFLILFHFPFSSPFPSLFHSPFHSFSLSFPPAATRIRLEFATFGWLGGVVNPDSVNLLGCRPNYCQIFFVYKQLSRRLQPEICFRSPYWVQCPPLPARSI